MADQTLTFEGKPCKYGHTLRYLVKPQSCAICNRLECQRRRLKLNPNLRPHERHGLKGHPLYQTWARMLRRCYTPSCSSYPWYGGRGITVCDRWRYSFTAFLADMGERPSPKHTPDRIDNSLGYFPENVRWCPSQSEQRQNSRGAKLTPDIVRLIRSQYVKGINRYDRGNTAELARRFGINRHTVLAIVTQQSWKNI